MIEKIVPWPIRTWVRRRVQETALNGMSLPVTVIKYQPYQKDSDYYVLPKNPDHNQHLCALSLPVPPRELWLGYGETEAEYLSSGERHTARMLEILDSSGFPLVAGERILDFGCGAGRMTRRLKDLSKTCEIWGTDIDARSIYWCKQYLEPPFHFFTTTTIAHLPFADGYFDFIYAGSVFTHIDDLADAWLLELRRVLSPTGRLYITVHDDHTMDLLDTQYSHTWLARVICSTAHYKEARKTGGKIVIGRDAYSQVFYDSGYLSDLLEPIYEIISSTREAYDYQTGILLKHRSRDKEH